MPGGRNSGAVYNMYKVKYKKHKRNNGNNPSAPGTPTSNHGSGGIGSNGSKGSNYSPHNICPPPSPISSNYPSNGRPGSNNPYSSQDRLSFESQGSSSNTSLVTSGPAGGGGLLHTNFNLQSILPNQPPPTSEALTNMYNPNKGLLGGVGILRAALTGSGDIPKQYQNLNRQSKEKYDDHHAKLIEELIACDDFEDIATLKNIGELLNQNTADLQSKLCQIGDSIVYKLVQWTRRLPFYMDLSVNVHTKLLTHKWHELLVLTTSAYQAIHGTMRMGTTRTDGEKVELHQEVATNLVTLQTCLTKMMGKPITMDQLRQDVGNMVEKITKVIAIFRQFQLKMEEYVCLKVIAMVSQDDLDDPSLCVIHDKYLTCLRTFTKKHFPSQPNRVEELLVRLPEVKKAASLLLESKMFYVPFLLNSSVG
jgi:hypothetical protein